MAVQNSPYMQQVNLLNCWNPPIHF